MKQEATLPIGVFGPDIQGFGTNDGILAFCLRIAGLPFADERAPLKNLYDLEMVKKILGPNARGLTLKEAVQKTFDQKKKGAIRFLFKQAEELGPLLKAFEDEREILKKREGDVAERVMELMAAMAAGDMDQHECVLRMACDILTARTEFNGMWKQIEPTIRIWDEGAVKITDTPRGKVAKHPGFKDVPLNASDELLKRMKLL